MSGHAGGAGSRHASLEGARERWAPCLLTAARGKRPAALAPVFQTALTHIEHRINGSPRTFRKLWGSAEQRKLSCAAAHAAATMSLKQMVNAPRPKTDEVEAFWDAHGGRGATAASLGVDDGDCRTRRGRVCAERCCAHACRLGIARGCRALCTLRFP